MIILELPCNVGDKVYYISITDGNGQKTRRINSAVVIAIHIINSQMELDVEIRDLINEYHHLHFNPDKCFGKRVFTDYESAERAIKNSPSGN